MRLSQHVGKHAMGHRSILARLVVTVDMAYESLVDYEAHEVIIAPVVRLSLRRTRTMEMVSKEPTQRIKFDLPESYARAIRARAAYDGVYPRDVIVAALDAYLVSE